TTVSAEVSSAISVHLFRRQLGFDDLAVGRVRLGEFFVGAAADDPSRVEDDDLVGLTDGRYALGDDDDRGLTGRFVEGGPQPRVGGDVEGGERIVEDVDLRFDGQRSGDAQTLSLPARIVRSSLGDPLFESV